MMSCPYLQKTSPLDQDFELVDNLLLKYVSKQFTQMLLLL